MPGKYSLAGHTVLYYVTLEESSCVVVVDKKGLEGHRKRLRGKFLKSGLSGLADYEVLELLLSYCIPRKDVKPIAKELIGKFHTLAGVLRTPANKLTEVEGIGSVAASFISLVHAVSVKVLEDNIVGKEVLDSYEDVIRFCKKAIGGLRYEVFYVIFMNMAGELIAAEEINEGTLTRVSVYPRKVIERAFYHNASIIALSHNHPGRTVVPSIEDVNITKMIVKAANSVDIRVFDHVIVTSDEHFSFKDSGLLS